MATAPTSVRANGYDVLLAKTRGSSRRQPRIPENIADRLALIKVFVSIAAKNSGLNIREIRFVIRPSLLTKPYLLRFHDALTSYCSLLQRSLTEATHSFREKGNADRLSRTVKNSHPDGFAGLEIHFGLNNKGVVTFNYEQVESGTRVISHPEAILT